MQRQKQSLEGGGGGGWVCDVPGCIANMQITY